ncbi:hypothetical protein TNCV_3015661 [Trichonephila clavipes]|nr:hypothetical protein TNCV_3015661 [Trichonephila clavipes]
MPRNPVKIGLIVGRMGHELKCPRHLVKVQTDVTYHQELFSSRKDTVGKWSWSRDRDRRYQVRGSSPNTPQDPPCR